MKLLKSKFFIISVAVVLSLALITGVLAMLGFTGPVKTVLGTVATPFRLFGTWASDAVNGFVEVFADYDDLKAENEALKNELQSLKDEKYNNEVLKEENEWLKEYIDVATEHPDFKLSDASVIARQSNNYSTVLTLNRGTAHGIKTKMPVITEEGLFGQVTEVGLDWCKVESIIETEVSVGVYSQRSGAGGVAKGIEWDQLGKESGMPTGKGSLYRKAGIKLADGGWDLDFPNAYCGHDPLGCNERIGKASVRFEAERLAYAARVMKEDTYLLERLAEQQKGWN